MKLNYKGWLIITPRTTKVIVTLENYGNGRIISFKVPNTITLKIAEDKAFTKVDEFEKEFAKELVKSGYYK